MQSLSFLNPKFQASSHLLWLYRLVCVIPGQKPRISVFLCRSSIFACLLFQAVVLVVNFYHRLQFFHKNPPPISTDIVKSNPYSVKHFRKLIDGCAFKMYGHWVKRADNQNRAALFEHAPREEWQSCFPR